MNARKALLAAANLIEQSGWTQRVNARNKSGYVVSFMDSAATSFCAAGALHRVAWDHLYVASKAEDRFRHIFGKHIITFNDAEGRTAAEVVKAMRQAARPWPLCYLKSA